MNNREAAKMLEQIADLLQMKEDNSFKVRAYRNAAFSLYNLDEDLRSVYEQGRLDQIPGVGKAVKGKIIEMLDTGTCRYYEELIRELPLSLLGMLAIPGIAHKTVKLVYEKLGISSVDELYQAAINEKLRAVPGIGAKSEGKIIKGIEQLRSMKDKVTLGLVLPVAQHFCNYLRAFASVKEISPVGSVRRGRPLVSDMDILVAGIDEAAIRQAVKAYPNIESIEQEEAGHIAGRIDYGFDFEVIIVPPEEYAEALFWTTGSKEHRSAVLGDKQRVVLKGVADEREVYNLFNMDYIAPELRENRGELEAARKGLLPEFLVWEDIKGDLHAHSNWSDGSSSIEEMAEAARALGFQYLAVTDHSRSLAVSGGLSIERLLDQGRIIDQLNQNWDSFRLLKGIEVDILRDGSLDLPDEVLEKLDIVVASIHSNFSLDKETQTERIIKAVKNQHVDIIGHLTGRLLRRRPGYELDIDKILEEVAGNHKILEINSHPDRLDIDEEVARRAKDMGIKIAINSDAHHRSEFHLINYGIINARRGWLEKKDIINTLDLKELMRQI